nr:MAG TPA: hypothetical protein [Caudoviricetes sp.]
MKFAIGIESISLNYEDEGKMLKEVEGYEEESINDNILHLEIQDYNSAMESINAEVDILLKQSNSIVGIEADKSNKPKDPLYKRIWGAIKKIFDTLCKLVSKSFNWIAAKFGIGGSEDAAFVTEAEANIAKTTTQIVIDSLRPENGVVVPEGKSKDDVILTECKKAVKEAMNDSTTAKFKSASWVSGVVAKNVAKSVSEAVEVVEKDTSNNETSSVIVIDPSKVKTVTYELYLPKRKNSSIEAINPDSKRGQDTELELAEKIGGFNKWYVNLALTIVRSVYSTLAVLYSNVVAYHKEQIKLYSVDEIKTEDDIKKIATIIKNLSTKVVEIKSNKNYQIKLEKVELKFKFDSNGKLIEDDFNSIMHSNYYYDLRAASTYIAENSKNLSMYVEKISDALNKADVNNLGEGVTPAMFNLMKSSLVDLKNISLALVNIMNKNSLKKLKKSVETMKEIDDQIEG